MKKILVIGATSDIAKSCIRKWYKRGDQLFLVYRNKIKMASFISSLNDARENRIFDYQLNLNDFEDFERMITEAEKQLGRLDIVLLAHGSLPIQKETVKSVEKTLQEIKINSLSTISLLTNLANRFEVKNFGTIAVLSSVAGNRGRGSNYIYGSSKAMIDNFLSGLRQRFRYKNVAFITIKLGLIDTNMTSKFKKNILWTDPEKISDRIVKVIDKKVPLAYIPRFWRLIAFVMMAIPERLFSRCFF